jgi:hypothetical protein
MKEFKSWSDIEVLDAEIEKLNKIKKEMRRISNI